MTLYAYRCDCCGADVERFHPLGSAPEYIDCPESSCDGRMRRLPSRGSFVAVPGGYVATHRAG